MWLELEHTTHRCFLQSAAVRQLSLGIEYGVVFLLHFSLCLRKWVPPPFLWSWCHGWVGWGAKNFFDQFFKEGSSLVLAVALKPLHRKLLVSGRTPAGWWRSFSTASGPGSRPSLSFLFCGGAACRCWLGTWPHDPCLGAACLCWFRAMSQ